jgi:hypothetical protein
VYGPEPAAPLSNQPEQEVAARRIAFTEALEAAERRIAELEAKHAALLASNARADAGMWAWPPRVPIPDPPLATRAIGYWPVFK